MNIQLATQLDAEKIQAVYWAAFDDSERVLVANLAISLLSVKSTPETLNLIAEKKGVIVGHIAFSPFKINKKSNSYGYILAPLGVKPEEQKRGIGTKLIEFGMQNLHKMGVGVVLVYGDPNYYSRFGFNTEVAELYKPPFTLKYPFGWQGIKLLEENLVDIPTKISCVESLNNPQYW